MIFNDLNPKDLLYFDIETVMEEKEYTDISIQKMEAWVSLCKQIEPDDDKRDFSKLWKEWAALYPEFAKIVCISTGYFDGETFKVDTFNLINCPSEKDLIAKFFRFVRSLHPEKDLAAHNLKNFDAPMVIKRALMYDIARDEFPDQLCIYNVKPWETMLVDTKDIWKFGSYRKNNSTSLDCLCAAFDVPTPKGDIDPKYVWDRFYEDSNDGGKYSMDENGMNEISVYCNNDVIALANVVQAMTGKWATNYDKSSPMPLH